MNRLFIVAGLFPLFAAATKTINVFNQCSSKVSIFINQVRIGVNINSRGTPGVIKSDDYNSLRLSGRANNGTTVGFNLVSGEYFIQKNIAFFDFGVTVIPADVSPANGLCPSLTCDASSCPASQAFTAAPALASTTAATVPQAPLFACLTANTFNVTFCPSGAQPNGAGLPGQIFSKRNTGNCLDIRKNVQAVGTPVQVYARSIWCTVSRLESSSWVPSLVIIVALLKSGW